MADAWEELQALKSKRDSRRKLREERKKEREDILRTGGRLIKPEGQELTATFSPAALQSSESSEHGISSSDARDSNIDEKGNLTLDVDLKEEGASDVIDVELGVLQTLCDVALNLPMDSRQLLITVNKTLSAQCQHSQIRNLLEKFAVQLLISIEERASDEGTFLEIISADHTKLSAMIAAGDRPSEPKKRKGAAEDDYEDITLKETPSGNPTGNSASVIDKDVLSLLSLASTREKENKRIGEEILELLSRPSAKEKTLAERFRSQGGTVVKEFCPQGTKSECRRVSPNNKPCSKLHFRKIIQAHTDESLGDCSFLNTCFHMESCKYVHYEVDSEKLSTRSSSSGGKDSGVCGNVVSDATQVPDGLGVVVEEAKAVLFPPQWIYCDLRYFDMTVLGKFSVVMADPPWDIHMELPYGTLSDDEMRQLNIPTLQDEGLIFLWVTGRAMELGRECLELWGYERVDELIWVKTNQLQRIIRTGRTGHWLNHGKEHCLVGMKGNPPINRGLDCDVLVAEVRATSHKPDEIYGIIERLSPGTRKIELFGRPHNIQPNWITLGNQLEGSHMVDEEVKKRFYERYPDGNCIMVKGK